MLIEAGSTPYTSDELGETSTLTSLPISEGWNECPPMRSHRPVTEGAIYQLEIGIPWRCVLAHFGAWRWIGALVFALLVIAVGRLAVGLQKEKG